MLFYQYIYRQLLLNWSAPGTGVTGLITFLLSKTFKRFHHVKRCLAFNFIKGIIFICLNDNQWYPRHCSWYLLFCFYCINIYINMASAFSFPPVLERQVLVLLL
ncbi:hypothetical protein CS542_08545 [Pedobacter sp. IW39]|nr:hypothetical protein CS542_08545 [Pedobacter sp. IW39]